MNPDILGIEFPHAQTRTIRAGFRVIGGQSTGATANWQLFFGLTPTANQGADKTSRWIFRLWYINDLGGATWDLSVTPPSEVFNFTVDHSNKNKGVTTPMALTLNQNLISPGYTFFMQLERDGNHAEDNINQPVVFQGLGVNFRCNSENEW